MHLDAGGLPETRCKSDVFSTVHFESKLYPASLPGRFILSAGGRYDRIQLDNVRSLDAGHPINTMGEVVAIYHLDVKTGSRSGFADRPDQHRSVLACTRPGWCPTLENL